MTPLTSDKHVANCVQASELLDEVISCLHFQRFPLPIKVRQIGKARVGDQDHLWQAQVIVTISVKDRVDGHPRDIQVQVPVHAHWEHVSMYDLRHEYLRRVYTAVRQSVLHELAECAVFEDRLFDDPHTGPTPYLLRAERDDRFPSSHRNNPTPSSEYGF